MTEKVGLIAVFDTSQFNKGLNDYLGGIGEANDATEKAEKGGFSFADALEVAVGNALVKVAELAVSAALKLGEIFVGTIEDAISLESAFAGVIKTTDGLTTSTGELNSVGEDLLQGYRDMAKEVPIAIEELMEIGEIGGQLGIQRDNLLDFTETIAALGVATNLSGEEAAVGLAQFANVIGTSQDDIDNLGSAIVYLGNNFATTEKDVLNFGSRIVGAGAIVGMTEGDILGIGTAFSSIGVGAEAGGTAVQKVLLGINEALVSGSDQVGLFAKTAGLSSKEFATLWEEDAASAFTAFVSGLGEAGDDASLILGELELKDQRLISSFLSLARNSELLEDSIDGANRAFEENTALTTEAETKFGTTESQIQILKNNFRDFGFTIGGAVVPAITEFITNIIPIIQEYGPKLEEIFSTVSEGLLNLVNAVFSFITKSGGIEGVFEGIKDAIGKSEFLQTLIDKFTEFSNTIVPLLTDSFQNLVDHFNIVKENFSIIWEGIKSVFSGALDIILGFVVVWQAAFNGEWELVWEGAKQMLQGAWEFITGILETALGVILTLVGTNLETLLTTISQVWEIIKLSTIEVFSNVAEFFLTVWTAISGSVVTYGTIIWEFLVTTFNAVSVFLTEVWTSISEFFLTAWEGIKTVFIVALGFIAALISGDMESAKEIITAVWESVSEFLSTTWESIQTTASEVFESIKTSVSEKFDEMKTASEEKWAAIQEGIKEKIEDLKTSIPETWESIKVAVDEKWEALKTAAEEKFSEIKESITAKFEEIKEFLSGIDLAEIGSNIIQGLADGISSATSAVTDAIGSAIQGAIDAAKEKLGIQSPSKVFAAIGLNVQQGFAGGITAGEQLPEQALTSSIDSLVSSPITTSTTNINNSRTANIEINNNGGGNGIDTTFYDVVGALGAVGIA